MREGIQLRLTEIGAASRMLIRNEDVAHMLWLRITLGFPAKGNRDLGK